MAERRSRKAKNATPVSPWAKFARQTLQRAARVADPTREDDIDTEPAPALEQWQDLALMYVERIPIMAAGARFYEAATERIRYTLITESDGLAVDNAAHPAMPIIDALNAHPQEVSRAVGLRYIIGESRHTAYLDTDGSIVIETYGANELQYTGGRYFQLDRDGKKTEVGADIIAWRSYDPDRRWSELATSSHKAMLDLLEAFIIAYAEERAISIRVATNAGIVVLSGDLFPMPDEADDDEVMSEGADIGGMMERRLSDMLRLTIKNPRDSASFVSPVLVAPPGADINNVVKHVPFAAERDKRKISERIEMLKREYAVGADLPADVAMGFMGDLNHWNAHIVDDNTDKNFISPKVQNVVADAFHEIAEFLEIDVTGVTVGLDTSQLVGKSDMSDVALKSYELGLISAASAREHTGFDEADAPTEEELAAAAALELPAQPDSIVAAADISQSDLDTFNADLNRIAKKTRKDIYNLLTAAAPGLVNESLTAAAGDSAIQRLATKIALRILKSYKSMGLAAARSLATAQAKDWYARAYPQLQTKAERAALHGAITAQTVMTVQNLETLPSSIGINISRSVESVAAGGTESVNHNGQPNAARPTTIVEDKDFVDLITGELGPVQTLYTWVHGDAHNPFPPHEELDGTQWVSADEREVLDNPNPFPASAVYHPGDHDGCTCSYDIDFEVVE